MTPGPGLLTASTEYTLVAVGNGLFDNGTNTSFALAQDLPVGSGALGAITTSTGTFVSSGSGGLKGATGIDFGPADKLFVASVNSDEVMRYQGPFDPSPGAPDGISTSRKSPPAVFVKAGLGGLDAPEWLQFGPDGNLYVVSSTKNQVFRYNGTTGASMGVFVTTSDHGLYSPTGLLFGQDRNLYVAGTRDDGGGIVQCYSGNGDTLIRTLDRNHTGGPLSPQGLTLGPDYNDDGPRPLCQQRRHTDEVLRYERLRTSLFPLSTPAVAGWTNRRPGFGADGNLYVSSLSTNEVLRYDGANGQFIDAYVAARREASFGLATWPGDQMTISTLRARTSRSCTASRRGGFLQGDAIRKPHLHFQYFDARERSRPARSAHRVVQCPVPTISSCLRHRLRGRPQRGDELLSFKRRRRRILHQSLRRKQVHQR